MQSFLVTGATGFLGSALVTQLLSQGYFVVGIGRRAYGFLPESAIWHTNFTFIKSDLCEEEWESKISPSIDGIFHCAAQQPSSRNVGYEDFFRGNVVSTQRVIAFAKKNNVKLFCYTSTSSVFGTVPYEGSMSAELNPMPASYYGLTKYIAERLVEIELRDTAIKAVIIRFPSLYGKNHCGGLVYTYYQYARRGEPIEVYGSGEQKRNILHSKDAVTVLGQVIKNLHSLGQYNIFMVGCVESISTAELANQIKNALNSRSEIVFINVPTPDIMDITIDSSKAEKLLQFHPMSIEKSIAMYIEEMN